MFSPIIAQLAGEETMDDVDGFREALVALEQARPACTHDMFVEAFSRPEAESEPVFAEERQCGRGLGDNGRVVAHDRACDGGHKAEALGGIGHGAQNRPGKRSMALLIDPR